MIPSPSDVEKRFGKDPIQTIETNLAEIRYRIALACERSHRSVSSVRLLPISKTVPSEVIRKAYTLGLAEFGENKVQEAKRKSVELADLPLKWSVVGHLQTNKAKDIVQFASEFQALDRLRLAAILNRLLEQKDHFLDVLVQVNTSGEETKFGLHPEEVVPFVEKLREYPRLRLRGLMTLALFSNDLVRVRKCFILLRQLRDTLKSQVAPNSMEELSMGMSGDFEIAIEEGATIIRVGQGIFGKRPGSDSQYWPGLIP